MKFNELVPNMSLLRRSILLDTRHIMTYVIRTIMLVFCLYFLYDVVVHQHFRTGALGLELFTYFTFINTIMLTGVGICYFSTIITEESEEQTLGLLLMTGITPFSMIISKLGSRLLFALTLLLAQLPLVLLTITLGGVNTEQIIAVYCCLISYTFFLAASGLFISVLSASTFTAYVLMIGFLGFFFFFHIFVDFLSGGLLQIVYISLDESPLYQFYNSWQAMSPFSQIQKILSFQKFQYIDFQAICCLVIGFYFFILSWLFFKYFRQKNVDTGIDKYFSRYNLHESKKLRLTGRVWNKAILWKEFNFSNGGIWGIILRCLFYCGLFCYIYCYSNNYSLSSIVDYGLRWGFIMLLLELSMIFSNLVKKEIQHNTLSSLAMLPININKTVNAKIMSVLPFVIPCISYMFILLSMQFYNYYYKADSSYAHFGWDMIALFSALTMFSSLLLFLTLYIKYGAFIISGLISFAVIFLSASIFWSFNSKTFQLKMTCTFLTIAVIFYFLFHKQLPKFCSK